MQSDTREYYSPTSLFCIHWLSLHKKRILYSRRRHSTAFSTRWPPARSTPSNTTRDSFTRARNAIQLFIDSKDLTDTSNASLYFIPDQIETDRYPAKRVICRYFSKLDIPTWNRYITNANSKISKNEFPIPYLRNYTCKNNKSQTRTIQISLKKSLLNKFLLCPPIYVF